MKCGHNVYSGGKSDKNKQKRKKEKKKPFKWGPSGFSKQEHPLQVMVHIYPYMCLYIMCHTTTVKMGYIYFAKPLLIKNYQDVIKCITALL